MSDKLINTTLDDVFKTTPLGSIDSSIASVLYGINHRQTTSTVPINKDGYGLTFFVKPQLNMSTPNIRAERSFIPLLTNQSNSIQRFIRCTLDPRLANDRAYSTPVVDKFSAFIPLLTNHLLTCSGWPDPVVEQFVSKPGIYKEVYSMTDSNMDIYSAYDINATFRNMQSDPITLLFYTWVKYQALVFEGVFVPYPDFIVKNEIDYNSRIYRLILDKNKRFVQKIACTGVATPITSNIGSAFDFSTDKPYNVSKSEIDIQFKCIGACYQDDIIVHEFNSVVKLFNPSMRDNVIKNDMVQVPLSLLDVFNGLGYPQIDLDSYELNWYVSKNDYARVQQTYLRHNSSLK
jgi:hypothetical protein